MQLIVLGMHRSGTSLVSRMLNLMGAYFGPEGVGTNANEENPKGFWERRDVRALNDMLLHSMGCDWNRLSTFDLERIPTAVLAEFHKAAGKLVLGMDGNRPWFIKEPRLMLLLPLWRQHLEAPVCIHMRRQPVETAGSLLRRNQMPMPVGLALWEFYKRLGLAASADLPCVDVAHRRMVTDPRAEVLDLLGALRAVGVTGLREPTRQEIDAFVDRGLYREREASPELAAYMDSPQAAMYARIDAGKPMGEEAGWQQRTRAVLAEYERSLPTLSATLQDQVARLDERVTAIDKELRAERERGNRYKAQAIEKTSRADALASDLSAASRAAAEDQRRLEQRVGELLAELAIARNALADARAAGERAHATFEAEHALAAGLRSELTHAREDLEVARAQWRQAALSLEREQARTADLREHAALREGEVQRQLADLQRQVDEQQREIGTWRSDSLAQVGRLREAAEALRQERERAEEGSREIVQLTRLLVATENSAASDERRATAELAAARDELGRQAAGIDQLTAALAASQAQLAAARAEIDGVYSSLSWRLAGPVRVLARWLRGRGAPDSLASDRRLIVESGWFDADWYRERYPDVAASNMDCAEHYLLHGALEGRQPGPRFDSAHYLERYADVAASRMNPLVHFLRHGKDEGRVTLPPSQDGTDR